MPEEPVVGRRKGSGCPGPSARSALPCALEGQLYHLLAALHSTPSQDPLPLRVCPLRKHAVRMLHTSQEGCAQLTFPAAPVACGWTLTPVWFGGRAVHRQNHVSWHTRRWPQSWVGIGQLPWFQPQGVSQKQALEPGRTSGVTVSPTNRVQPKLHLEAPELHLPPAGHALTFGCCARLGGLANCRGRGALSPWKAAGGGAAGIENAGGPQA